MVRYVAVVAVAFFLVSCETETGAPGTPEQPATPEVEKAMEGTKAPAEGALGDLKKVVSTPEESGGATEALKKAAEGLPDISKALESSFSVDQLKQMVGSVSTDDLKGLADKLVAAIQEQGVDVQGLKDKLQVVVDSLKEKGIDVSKYTSILTG